MSPNTLASVNAFACRVPIRMPTKVAFGTLCDRPMLPDRLLEVLVLQTGEVGLTGQATAGVDIALWNSKIRRSAPPMYRHLVASSLQPVPVCATGINPDEPHHFAGVRSAEGHRTLRLNTRLRHDLHMSNLTADLAALPPYQTWLQA